LKKRILIDCMKGLKFKNFSTNQRKMKNFKGG
jgi:hypothetical protein